MLEISDLHELLVKTQEALNRLVKGDPEPYEALWSHLPDVTVLGGFGGYALGWDQVKENAEFAASRFRDGHLDGFRQIAGGESNDLAYSIWIEYGQVRVAGREESSPLVVRVTHIFRRENGAWKIIHRHGDAVIEKTEATAILQR
ncbi:MAG TPA: nuclear transport factor 2 family protein [Anaerolineaceae bacterium]|nr:nuclear transport factor 2 family protein [Anaerolineaceae bacterium]